MSGSVRAYPVSPQQRAAGERAVTCASIRVDRPLDGERLAKAVRTLVARHEVLRTRFVTQPETGELLQVVDPAPAGTPAESSVTVETCADGQRVRWVSPARLLDEASFTVLVGELAAAYAGQLSGPEPLQYADYASWILAAAPEASPVSPGRGCRSASTSRRLLPHRGRDHVLATWRRVAGADERDTAIRVDRRDVAELAGAVGPYNRWVGDETASVGLSESAEAVVSCGGVRWELERAWTSDGPPLVLRLGPRDAWLEYDESWCTPETAARLLDKLADELGAPSAPVPPNVVTHACAPARGLAVTDGVRSWTRAQFAARARQVAAAVHAHTGGRREAPVVLAAALGLEAVAALVGTWQAGGAAVLIDPVGPAERVRAQLAVAAPVVALTDRPDALRTFTGPRVAIDPDATVWAARPPGDGAVRPPLSGQLAYIVFTSGSSGAPKAVDIPHGAMAAYARSLVDRLDARPGRSWALLTPLTADLGLTALLGAVWTGGTLVVQPGWEANLADADYAKITPRHLELLLDAAAEPGAVLPRRAVVIGGEQWDLTLRDRLRALRPDLHVVNHYGPTETTVGVLVHPLGEADAGVHPPLGTPLDHVTVAVADADGETVPDGAAGELLVGGPTLARGYRGRPALTAERFRPDPGGDGARCYATGDLVCRNMNGTYQHLGRVDAQLSINGFRLEPAEVEDAVRAHPAVAAAAVTSIDDGASVHALLVAAEAVERPSLRSLRAFLAERVPAPVVPAGYTWVTALPLTPSGKLDRPALRGLVARPGPAPSEPALPGVEATLAEVWSDVLGIDRPGALDNFFALGGDSIKSLQVVSRARAAGLQVTPRDVFERPTVRALAAVAVAIADPGAAPVEPPGPVPLLPAAAEFFARNGSDPHHYNQSFWLTAANRLNVGLLRQALRALVERHDALRTGFMPGLAGWVSVLDPAARDVPVEVVDYSARSPDEAARAAARLAGDAQRSLTLGQPPLMRAWVVRMPHGADRLLWVAHHLVVDGVSWQVLFEQVQRAYLQLDAGDEIDLGPATVSHRAWARQMEQRLPHEPAEAPPIDDLPPPTEAARTVADTGSTRTELTPAATADLLDMVAPAFGLAPLESLVGVLAEAVARWSGRPSVRMEVETHGRDLVDGLDSSRTVGWLTARLSLLVTADLSAGAAERLLVAKHALRAATPGAPAEPPAPVGVNFFGRTARRFPPGSPFTEFSEVRTGVRAPTTPLRHRVEVSAEVIDDRLSLDWTHGRHPDECAALAALAEHVAAIVTELAAECRADAVARPVPADFPAASITADDLDQLLTQWHAEEFG